MTFVAIWSKALSFSDSPFCRIRTFWYSDTPPPISSHKRNPLSQTCDRDDLVGRIRLQIVSTLRSCAVRSPSIALIRIWVSRFSIPLQSSRQEVVIRIGGWVCNKPDKANGTGVSFATCRPRSVEAYVERLAAHLLAQTQAVATADGKSLDTGLGGMRSNEVCLPTSILMSNPIPE